MLGLSADMAETGGIGRGLGLIPIIDFEVIGRGLTCPGFHKPSETQEERCPFHAAMGRELACLPPLLMPKEHDRVLTLLGKVEDHFSPYPFFRAVRETPLDLLVGFESDDLYLHFPDFLPISRVEAHSNRAADF